jgi:hypothetical protein
MRFLSMRFDAVARCVTKANEPDPIKSTTDPAWQPSIPVHWTGDEIPTPHEESDAPNSGVVLTIPMPEAQLCWDQGAAHLGLPPTRLHDGVLTGEYPVTDPQGPQPFSLADLEDIRIIDRQRHEAEDRQAAALPANRRSQ